MRTSVILKCSYLVLSISAVLLGCFHFIALHSQFPQSPHAPLHPGHRWFPGDDAIRESGGAEKLIPPLVDSIRRKVHVWRESGYEGASPTSKHCSLFCSTLSTCSSKPMAAFIHFNTTLPSKKRLKRQSGSTKCARLTINLISCALMPLTQFPRECLMIKRAREKCHEWLSRQTDTPSRMI